jgi:hypothetical protein
MIRIGAGFYEGRGMTEEEESVRGKMEKFYRFMKNASKKRRTAKKDGQAVGVYCGCEYRYYMVYTVSTARLT